MSENDLRKQQLSGFYLDIDIKPGYDTETPVEKKERELEGIRRSGQKRRCIQTWLNAMLILILKDLKTRMTSGDMTGIKLALHCNA